MALLESDPNLAERVDLTEFRQVVQAGVDRAEYRWAADWADQIPIYDAAGFDSLPSGDRADLIAELTRVFGPGPGVAVFIGAFDSCAVDRASAAFFEMIAEQHRAGESGGDHFAAAGANDRVWNSLEKLAVREPAVHVDYFDTAALEFASLAWLGPGYQVTAQVNVVHPGGAAQAPHRDYHLGFMDDAQASAYPAHVHDLSPALTLQGAVAHVDIPVEAGATNVLPHSHKYRAGYLAWRRSEFAEYFAANRVQHSLAKGDAMFFNPALFHGAGHNRTADVARMANLFQISSAFGRAMERIDRQAMVAAVYPELLAAKQAGRGDDTLRRVIAATAEGYPFPGDLDHDQPVGGMAPPSQAELVWEALANQVAAADLPPGLAG